MSIELRTLTSPEDRIALEVFLDRHIETSVFLRSNVMMAGLVDRGEPFQATYVAACQSGEVIAVAAHNWNGNLNVQAPVALEDVVREAVTRSGREVAGDFGPYPQVVAARAVLGFSDRPSVGDGLEQLFSLDLAELIVPEALRNGRLVCRAPLESELPLLGEWRVAYCIETLGERDTPKLQADATGTVENLHRRSSHWILVEAGAPVSYSAFNARLPRLVQIGGVFTPRELRSKGYARAVVAGSLLQARREGATKAILFTQDANEAAQRAYQSLGFRRIGDFGLLLFRS